jgi:hypothetical protein
MSNEAAWAVPQRPGNGRQGAAGCALLPRGGRPQQGAGAQNQQLQRCAPRLSGRWHVPNTGGGSSAGRPWWWRVCVCVCANCPRPSWDASCTLAALFFLLMCAIWLVGTICSQDECSHCVAPGVWASNLKCGIQVVMIPQASPLPQCAGGPEMARAPLPHVAHSDHTQQAQPLSFQARAVWRAAQRAAHGHSSQGPSTMRNPGHWRRAPQCPLPSGKGLGRDQQRHPGKILLQLWRGLSQAPPLG